MKRTGIRRAVIRQLQRGEHVPAFAPKRYPNSHGYVRLRWLVGTQEYVETYEHRVVDGIVTDAEQVHHRNRNRSDNRPENLRPMTAKEHGELHASETRGNGAFAPYRSRYAKEKAERAKTRREEVRNRALEMRRMYLEEGLSTTEIGKIVGLDASGVSRHLRRIGVKMRPSGPRYNPDEVIARNIIRDRSDRICERCGGAPATDAHHRRNRSQGGKWEASNLMHLCRDCHAYITTNPTESYEQGWMVRRIDDPSKTPVWLFGWGFVYLTDSGKIELFEET